MRKLAVLTGILLALGGSGQTTAQANSEHWSKQSIIKGLLCIHTYEGTWNDSGWPHWGGLQMDMNFQLTYGREFFKRWGTADHWPVWAQLETGYRGAISRGGFNPWPNTRKMCRLPAYF